MHLQTRAVPEPSLFPLNLFAETNAVEASLREHAGYSWRIHPVDRPADGATTSSTRDSAIDIDDMTESCSKGGLHDA